jgi:hypothetical protein
MFSHFQYLAYLVGVAKLPFRIPASNAKPTAKGTFDIEESSLSQKSEIRNQKTRHPSVIPIPQSRDRNDISRFLGARQPTGMSDCLICLDPRIWYFTEE